MIVRALDSSHDWTFGKGKSDYLKDNDAIAQNVNTRLNSFLGDCFFDLGAGIDWFNLLGSKNITGLNLAMKSVILNTTNVTGLIELSFQVDENRRVKATYSANTVFSKISGSIG